MSETRARDLADLGVDATGLATDAELSSGLALKPTATYGTTEPSSPAAGDIWYDSNDDPATPKYYDGTEFVPFPSGAGDAVISSPSATGNYTDGEGVEWDYYTFTSSGTLTVAEGGSGFVDVLVVGGGGGPGAGKASQYGGCGGGGGGMLEGTFYLEEGTYPVVVGAGGAFAGANTGNPGTQGNDSEIGTDGRIVAFGGGYGSGNTMSRGGVGGSGGGQYSGGLNRGVTGQGHASGNPSYIYGANGGGAGGPGVTGTGTATGSYGPGKTSSITGTSVEYARGGGGGLQPRPGTGNRGNGGSSPYAGNTDVENAQPGIVVVRVKV